MIFLRKIQALFLAAALSVGSLSPLQARSMTPSTSLIPVFEREALVGAYGFMRRPLKVTRSAEVRRDVAAAISLGVAQSAPRGTHHQQVAFEVQSKDWDPEVKRYHDEMRLLDLRFFAFSEESVHAEEVEYNTYIRKRSADAIQALESLFFTGVHAGIIGEYFEELSVTFPDRAQPVVQDIARFFRSPSAHWTVYKIAAETLKNIAGRHPELIDQNVISSLESFMTRGRGVGGYEIYPVAQLLSEVIESNLRSLHGNIELVWAAFSAMENVFLVEGLSEDVYLTLSAFLSGATERHPTLARNGSLASVLLKRPTDIHRHSLSHYKIYLNAHFLDVTQSLSEPRRYSIALAAHRLLLRHARTAQAPSEDDVTRAVDFILQHQRNAAQQVLIAPGHHVITISHQDRNFQETVLLDLASRVGATTLATFKGVADKSAILKAVKSEPGPLTILFDGHGGRNHLWLGEGTIGDEYSTNLAHPKAISYAELADAIALRRDRTPVTLLLSACYSYNFSVQVLSQIALHGRPLPIIASSSNYDRISKTASEFSGGRFIDALYEATTPDQPLKVSHILTADELTFEAQDGALFLPLSSQDRQDLSRQFGALIDPRPVSVSRDVIPTVPSNSLVLSGPAGPAEMGRPLDLPAGGLELGNMWMLRHWPRSVRHAIETALFSASWFAGLYFGGNQTFLTPLLIATGMSLLHAIGKDPHRRPGESSTFARRWLSGHVAYANGQRERYGWASGLRLAGFFFVLSWLSFGLLQTHLIGPDVFTPANVLTSKMMSILGGLVLWNHFLHFVGWNRWFAGSKLGRQLRLPKGVIGGNDSLSHDEAMQEFRRAYSGKVGYLMLELGWEAKITPPELDQTRITVLESDQRIPIIQFPSAILAQHGHDLPQFIALKGMDLFLQSWGVSKENRQALGLDEARTDLSGFTVEQIEQFAEALYHLRPFLKSERFVHAWVAAGFTLGGTELPTNVKSLVIKALEVQRTLYSKQLPSLRQPKPGDENLVRSVAARLLIRKYAVKEERVFKIEEPRKRVRAEQIVANFTERLLRQGLTDTERELFRFLATEEGSRFALRWNIEAWGGRASFREDYIEFGRPTKSEKRSWNYYEFGQPDTRNSFEMLLHETGHALDRHAGVLGYKTREALEIETGRKSLATHVGLYHELRANLWAFNNDMDLAFQATWASYPDLESEIQSLRLTRATPTQIYRAFEELSRQYPYNLDLDALKSARVAVHGMIQFENSFRDDEKDATARPDRKDHRRGRLAMLTAA